MCFSTKGHKKKQKTKKNTQKKFTKRTYSFLNFQRYQVFSNKQFKAFSGTSHHTLSLTMKIRTGKKAWKHSKHNLYSKHVWYGLICQQASLSPVKLFKPETLNPFYNAIYILIFQLCQQNLCIWRSKTNLKGNTADLFHVTQSNLMSIGFGSRFPKFNRSHLKSNNKKHFWVNFTRQSSVFYCFMENLRRIKQLDKCLAVTPWNSKKENGGWYGEQFSQL